jgi:hypothetical protein
MRKRVSEHKANMLCAAGQLRLLSLRTARAVVTDQM